MEGTVRNPLNFPDRLLPDPLRAAIPLSEAGYFTFIISKFFFMEPQSTSFYFFLSGLGLYFQQPRANADHCRDSKSQNPQMTQYRRHDSLIL